MKYWQIYCLFSVIFAFSMGLISCNESKVSSNFNTVTVNLDAVNIIPLSNARIIELETNDSSLIYEIYNLVKIDDRLYVHSRNLLKVFSDADGHYISDVGRLGHGPGEYAQINQIWAEGSNICIHDFDSNCALVYNNKNECITKRQPFFDRVHQCYPSQIILYPDSSCIIALSTYRGSPEKHTPLASIRSLNNEFKRIIPGREVLDGGSLNTCLAKDYENNRILYWQGLKDTIFEITTDSIRPIYAIDFGQYRFPGQDDNNLFGKVRRLKQELKNGARYATLIQDVQKWHDLILFDFTTDYTDTFYIGALDTKSNKIQVYELRDDKFAIRPFMRLIGDNLYIELKNKENDEANPALLIFPARYFKKFQR